MELSDLTHALAVSLRRKYTYTQCSQKAGLGKAVKSKMSSIHICNTNKCTYKSVYKLYSLLYAPTCFCH
jgi:hypothetical protein